jgi:4'-phosphopantetheinyl transferase
VGVSANLDDGSSMIPLQKEAIHLWLCSCPYDQNRELDARYRILLDTDERTKEMRFHFERDRRRFLMTRALVRIVLSRYLPVEPQMWSFLTNAYGRPRIANEESRSAGLDFNVSHTDGLIVLGISAFRRLGVDTENIRMQQAPVELADRFFSRHEVEVLSRVPRDRQQERFFEYWTFKEAYIKARGMGLSIPLDRFTFDLPDRGEVRLSVAPELKDDQSNWQFWQFRPAAEHLLAICAERVAGTRVVIRRIVTLDTEEIISPTPSRTSEHQALEDR